MCTICGVVVILRSHLCWQLCFHRPIYTLLARLHAGSLSLSSSLCMQPPSHKQAWNTFNNVPTGKYRVSNGGSDWLASSKPASLPFQSSGSMSVAKLSNLKKLIPKYWPFSSNSSLTLRRSTTPIPLGGFTLPGVQTTRFILLCSLWYTTSALSSNTGKTILTQFRYPVTLTFIQFGFVAFYCILFMSPAVRFSKVRMPTKAIIKSTLPMGMFQVGGHMFSSMAISRIPVSTVHTIKVYPPLILFFLAPDGILGPVPAFHSSSVCPLIRRLLLGKNLYLLGPVDTRRHACVHI